MKYLDKDGLTYLWGKIKAKIPTKTSDLTNDSGYTTNTGTITGVKMNGSTVASSGVADLGTVITDISGKQDKITSSNKLDYSLLTNTPTIPTVNDATLTIQKNGTTVKTFTANASSNVTANITVPTKTSDITNDSGYITSYTETDPVFTASAAYGISSSDITTWNNKSDFSGSYNDLTDKPTIPSALTAGRSINISSNQINNTGVTNVEASPSSAANGTVAVTKGTTTGTNTSYVAVKGLDNAAYKDVDTSISAASTSTKLPTSSAVASFVEGKGYTTNTGTITKVQANGTDVASSGTANIPSATTGRYGVTKLSSSTSSTSTTLAATASAVKSAYDRASTAITTADSKIGGWNYLDYISPGITTSVTLPSSFNEILCDIVVDDNTSVQLTIVIPSDRLSSTAAGFRSGYYRSANVNAYARVDVTSTEVTLNEVYLNGTAKTSSSTVYVYYR